MTSLFRHQFCITTLVDPLGLLPHFIQHSVAGFRVAVAPDLPVTQFSTTESALQGLLLGWPILDGELLEHDVALPAEAVVSTAALESWLYTLAGRWVAIVCSADTQRIYMDALASQSLIYQPELRRVASSPGLIEAEPELLLTPEQLIKQDYWYPAGCTAYTGVARLLANHYLDLDTFVSVRHWPRPDTDLAVTEDWFSRIPEIASLMRQQLTACAAKMPLRIGLTAGLESRVMLSCSKGLEPAPLFWTRSDQAAGQYQDVKTASVLAHRFELLHTVLPFTVALSSSGAERSQFMSNTGYCVGGSPLKSAKLIDSAGPCFAFTGIGGEIGRAYYYDADKPCHSLSAELLLKLAGLPQLPPFVDAIARYLSVLPKLELQQQLALFYLENRVSAFGAVHRYAYQSGIVLLSPFSHRAIVQCMLTLPLSAQLEAQFHKALIQQCWPELLTIPFNTPLDFNDKLYRLGQRISARLKRFRR